MPGFGPALQFKDGFGNVVASRHHQRAAPGGGDRGRRHGRDGGLQRRGRRPAQHARPAACSCGRPRRPSPMRPSASWPPPPRARTCWTSCTRWPAPCATASTTRSAAPTPTPAPPRRSPTARACARTTPTSSSPPPAPCGVPARYVTGYLVLGEHEPLGGAPCLGGSLGGGPGLGRLRRRQPHLPDRALRAAGRRARCRRCRAGGRLAPRRRSTRRSTSPSRCSSRAPSSDGILQAAVLCRAKCVLRGADEGVKQ